uniref:Helicase ATP-binding domain-containing protein n=1 Tax=viral metagenome TaxID=1070528 RepID=A0A6C0BAK8_9ZZZZ
MDQSKLTKSEWCSIEVPLPPAEQRIIEFLGKASHTPDKIEHSVITLLDYLKLPQSPAVDLFLCHKYFAKSIKDLIYKFKLPAKEQIKLKKADQIRLNTSTEQIPPTLYECILLDICKQLPSNPHHFYTLHVMFSYNLPNVNIYIQQMIREMLDVYTFPLKELVLDSVSILENNPYIYKYKPLELYPHQKQLFEICKHSHPKLILYTAQTGQGKTLSPIGASNFYDAVIFMCAHRHIALALARAAIAVKKKIATAFGAKSKEDVKLHYYAVTKCVRDKRNGKIKQVDNSDGNKVEILICDIESFVHAKEYMLQFKAGNRMMVWLDEPTITLDYDSHPLHELYQKNWKSNTEITTVVLSSATLPSDMITTIQSFTTTFPDAHIYNVSSYDTTKTVQLLNAENQIEMPHYHCPTFQSLQECIVFLESKRLIMKYVDLHAILEFLKTHSPDFSYFKTVADVTIDNIKRFYIHVLKTFTPESWPTVYKAEQERRIVQPATIEFCTKDAHTLEHGPSIYITDDVDNVAKYCIKTSSIPEEVLTTILKNLGHNAVISEKITQLEKDLEDANSKDEDKEKKMVKNQMSPEVRVIQNKLTELYDHILPMVLPDEYIPNKKSHLAKYGHVDKLNTAFSSNIDSTIAKEILSLDIDNKWKLLLLMGIGVFAKHTNSKYMEIMKQLATQQYLFMIIADSDYIYGTNYLLCQGYIGNGMKLTPEKIIQAIGRVGRGQQGQKNSIRFRNIQDVQLLFFPQTHNPEIENMKKIYF